MCPIPVFFPEGSLLVCYRSQCHILSPLPLPVRWPSEDLEEKVVHPDRQLPLLL